MIHFPVLRTRRLTIQLRELSMAESIAVASIPPHLDEASCTAFLRRAVESATGVSDSAQWTVQERTLAVCHYLACTLEDGPDFAVGKGKFSDYLDGAADAPASNPEVEVGELGGDAWTLRHLTGAMAESIERLSGEVEGIKGRLHWLLGAMACQLVRAGESVPDASDGEGAFDDFLRHRMAVLSAFPESAFAALMGMFLQGRDQLHHLFRVEFSADGLVVMAKGGVASDLPPARFPVHACLSQMARDLC
jgi:hypothetical protein